MAILFATASGNPALRYSSGPLKGCSFFIEELCKQLNRQERRTLDQIMMEVIHVLSPTVHKLEIEGQDEDFQFVPQMLTSLRRDIVFWPNRPDNSPNAGKLLHRSVT